MTEKIDLMYPMSGRHIKEDGEAVNIADIIDDVYDEANGVLKTSANIEVGDIQIGAVEIKDATTDKRAVVGDDGLHVMPSPHTSVFQGNLTLNGTTQQLSASQASKSVTIQADPSNVGSVKIGTSALDSTHYMYILSAGSSATFNVNNANLLYALGTSNDKVSFGGEG
jgi:hypothetical protein